MTNLLNCQFQKWKNDFISNLLNCQFQKKKTSKKNDFIYKFDLFQGNIYEEISTNDEVPSAPPVYERQPFIGHEFTGHDCSLEPNNNPKNPLGENYFMLDPNYRDCRTLLLNPSDSLNKDMEKTEMELNGKSKGKKVPAISVILRKGITLKKLFLI